MLKKFFKLILLLVFCSLGNIKECKAEICSYPGVNVVCYAVKGTGKLVETAWNHKLLVAEAIATLYLVPKYLRNRDTIKDLDNMQGDLKTQVEHVLRNNSIWGSLSGWFAGLANWGINRFVKKQK